MGHAQPAEDATKGRPAPSKDGTSGQLRYVGVSCSAREKTVSGGEQGQQGWGGVGGVVPTLLWDQRRRERAAGCFRTRSTLVHKMPV